MILFVMPEDTDKKDDEPEVGGRVTSVSFGVPGFRAKASFTDTLRRAFQISALGLSVNIVTPAAPREKDIQRALDALASASTLVTELERELTETTSDLTKLKEEYEHYSQLTAVERESAMAILEEVDATVGRGLPRERWIAAAINLVVGLLIFFLGIAFERYLH